MFRVLGTFAFFFKFCQVECVCIFVSVSVCKISLCLGCSFSKRKGIVINETDVVVYAQLLTGRKYVIGQNGSVHLEKQFAKQVLPFPYQTIVKVNIHTSTRIYSKYMSKVWNN